jgi:hypothetical protein
MQEKSKQIPDDGGLHAREKTGEANAKESQDLTEPYKIKNLEKSLDGLWQDFLKVTAEDNAEAAKNKKPEK